MPHDQHIINETANETTIYHNGAYIQDTAIFPFQDRIRLGDGVFDTMLVTLSHNKPPVFTHADLHFTRVLHDAEILKIDTKALPGIKNLQEIAIELIMQNTLPPGRYALNTLITRGIATRGVMPATDTHPSITMRFAPVPESFPHIHAIINETIRRNEGSPLSQIKSCNYGDNILALLEAREQNANEAILLNNTGHATCASAGNIFVLISDELITPPLHDGVLDGITRKTIIKKNAVTIRSIEQKELENAQSIFISNSIRGITPITSLNGKALPPPSLEIKI